MELQAVEKSQAASSINNASECAKKIENEGFPKDFPATTKFANSEFPFVIIRLDRIIQNLSWIARSSRAMTILNNFMQRSAVPATTFDLLLVRRGETDEVKRQRNGIIKTMRVYLNGKIVDSRDAVVSVFDHGFLYGDGIYETMRVYDGVVFRLDQHIRRLFRSASLIGLSIPLDVDRLRIAIYETLIANALRKAYIRLTVSRGRGPIGLDPSLCAEPTVVIVAQELKEYPGSLYKNGIHLIISETRRNSKEAIDPHIKSLNFLNNILAKIEAKKKGAYEAIMLNVNGHLAEGTISNIFFYKDNMLCTPSAECGILDGITRGVVIELARTEGMRVREGKFTVKDIYAAGEVFLTNTTMEVMPVSNIDDRRYTVGSVSKLLRKLYREEVNAYISDVKAEGPSLWGENQ